MYVAAVFLPLIGAIVAGLFGRWIGDRGAQVVTCGLVGLSAILSIPIFLAVVIGGQPQSIELFTWMQSGSLDASWALKFDTLTAVMLIVVTWVSFMCTSIRSATCTTTTRSRGSRAISACSHSSC